MDAAETAMLRPQSNAALRARPQCQPRTHLIPREEMVLLLREEGLSYRAIGERLQVSGNRARQIARRAYAITERLT